MTFDTARTYSAAEVDERVGALMKELPAGSSITSQITNEGRTVTLVVRLPDGAKQDTFEHGWIGRGGTLNNKSRLGRQGPPFDEIAAKTIIKWSAKP